MKLEPHQIRLIANWFESAVQVHPLALYIPATLTGDALRVRMAEIARRNPHLFLEVL